MIRTGWKREPYYGDLLRSPALAKWETVYRQKIFKTSRRDFVSIDSRKHPNSPAGTHLLLSVSEQRHFRTLKSTTR